MPKPKTILLNNVADIIKYFKGDLPDWNHIGKSIPANHDLRITESLYLKALELMENAKHIF